MKGTRVPFWMALVLCSHLTMGCQGAGKNSTDGDDDSVTSDTGADGDTDADTDTDTDTDTDSVPSRGIPKTCQEAAAGLTTVGCVFYTLDLDSEFSSELGQVAVAVSNVSQTETAAVQLFQPELGAWIPLDQTNIQPMQLATFDIPESHQEESGLKPWSSFKLVSDIPVVAYQFNPVDGQVSMTSDASMLIPVSALSLTYDIIGWRQNPDIDSLEHTAYFTVVAVMDGTVVTVSPSSPPAIGPAVPGTGAPFTVAMQDGDILEVATGSLGASMSGSRVTSNPDHPIIVFSGHECADIPDEISFCDHLEEQMPGLKFWGTRIVASRVPPRNSIDPDIVAWHLYASEDNTQVTITASPEVEGLPGPQLTMSQGELAEFFTSGTPANPGDFFVEADKPIALMQYMTGSGVAGANDVGDPAMVYIGPTEQFLTRYVVLIPTTWNNDALVITRHVGVPVLLDGAILPDSEFAPVADCGFEVARHLTPDGVHTLTSGDESYGLGVIVVGWDQRDSYAYAGGLGMVSINPTVE